MCGLFAFILVASLCRGAPQRPIDHGEVMKDINNLYMHYTDELCVEINRIQCSTTHAHNTICGSDNVQYHDHCAFAQARCKDPNLTVLMKQACQVLTYPPSSPTSGSGLASNPTGGMNPTGGATHGMNPTGGATGGMNPTGGATGGMNPTGGMMSTSSPMATADPALAVIKDVFCDYSSQITCSSSPQKKICGTDGNLYDNQCMFSKVKCFKSDLEVATDQTSCNP